MCCPNSQAPRRMSEKEIEMRARWRRERERVLTEAYNRGATPAQLDTLTAGTMMAEIEDRARLRLRTMVSAEWIGQDTLPGFSEVFATNGTITRQEEKAAEIGALIEDTTIYTYSTEPVVIEPSPYEKGWVSEQVARELTLT